MKKQIIIGLILVFIQGIVQNIGHPVTPTYVTQLGINERFFGYFFSAMSLGLFLGAPLWGVLGDINSKKKYIMIGLIMYGLGQFLFGYTKNENLMILFRFFSGFSAASAVTLMNVHFINLSTKENRTKILSFSVAMLTLGSSVGYYIGGFIGNYVIRETFYIQALMVLSYVVLFGFVFREIKKPKTKVSSKTILNGFTNIRYLEAPLIIFMIMLMLVNIATMNVIKFNDVFVIDNGYLPYDLGLLTLATGAVAVFTNLILVPLLLKWNKNMKIMIVNLFLSAIIIYITFRMNNLLLSLYSFFLLFIVMKSAFQPLEMNYIASHNKDGNYGLIMGVRQSFISIGYVIGPFIGGYLYEANHLLVFDVSSMLFIISFILLISLYVFKKKKDICLEN